MYVRGRGKMDVNRLVERKNGRVTTNAMISTTQRLVDGTMVTAVTILQLIGMIIVL